LWRSYSIIYYVEPEPFVQSKVLAARSGKTVQELNLETLNPALRETPGRPDSGLGPRQARQSITAWA
jgi:hypothetical protein